MGLFRKFRSWTPEWVWEELVPASGSEPNNNRFSATLAQNGAGGKLILASGQQSGSPTYGFSDLWTFDLGTKVWTQVATSGIGPQYNNDANKNNWPNKEVVAGYSAGYCDGSGNLIIGGTLNWGTQYQNTALQKVNISTGATTQITDAGLGTSLFGGLDGPALTVNPASARIYFAGQSGATPKLGGSLVANSVNIGGNTNSQSLITQTAVNRTHASSLAYLPSANTLYMVAPPYALSPYPFALDTASLWKYNLTTNSGWVQETGVTNSVTSLTINNASQLVWSSADSRFYLFCAGTSGQCERVVTFDPASKVWGEAFFRNTSPTSILVDMRGNAGSVVVDGADFYFYKYDLSLGAIVRIWKFYRKAP